MALVIVRSELWPLVTLVAVVGSRSHARATCLAVFRYLERALGGDAAGLEIRRAAFTRTTRLGGLYG